MSGIETPNWEEQQAFSHIEGATNPADKHAHPADGTKVGDIDKSQDSLDKKEKNKENVLMRAPTLEEMTLQRDISNIKLDKAAKGNPDWPPAKGNPEAEVKLSQNLEAGMNGVV